MTPVLKPGDCLRDNDSRMNGRILTVVVVGDTHVICDGAKRTSIALKRIFYDDKPRKSDFTFIGTYGSPNMKWSTE